MRKNKLMALDIIAKGEKEVYMRPSCATYCIDSESMICSSVTGETENEDVSGNQGDPWNTGQND